MADIVKSLVEDSINKAKSSTNPEGSTKIKINVAKATYDKDGAACRVYSR